MLPGGIDEIQIWARCSWRQLKGKKMLDATMHEQIEQLSICPQGGITLGGFRLVGLLDLVSENGRWMLWRRGNKDARPRVRCVTAVIADPDALKRVISKMLVEIGVKNPGDLQARIGGHLCNTTFRLQISATS
jgi:hypothetical protein